MNELPKNHFFGRFTVHSTAGMRGWATQVAHITENDAHGHSGHPFGTFDEQARAAVELAIKRGQIRRPGSYIVTYVFPDGSHSSTLVEVERVTQPSLRVKR